MSFEMKIIDVFHFFSGYTIFVGPVKVTNNLIKGSQKVELLINRASYQIIETYGEWIANSKYPEGHRAISTLDPVTMTSEFVKEHDCVSRAI